jgi:hypothetical protein
MTFVRVRFRRFIGETLAVRNHLRAFPSHEKGRRFNPYSAHHATPQIAGFSFLRTGPERFATERSDVLMVQSGQDRNGDNDTAPLHCSVCRAPNRLSISRCRGYRPARTSGRRALAWAVRLRCQQPGQDPIGIVVACFPLGPFPRALATLSAGYQNT